MWKMKRGADSLIEKGWLLPGEWRLPKLGALFPLWLPDQYATAFQTHNTQLAFKYPHEASC